MLDPTYPLFPVFAFLGFFLGLLPLSWHLQAWNVGTCAYMLWSSLACLVEFINAIAWKETALNPVPVWCDISSKFILGAGIGIPASAMCISRRLYYITAVQTVSVTREEKRRAFIGDLCIVAGIPVLVMILHYVVQGHRFNILENIGCYATIYNTIPAYFLVLMWPALIGCISFVYSGLTLRAFWKRRLQFSEFLSSNTSLSVSRYMRLMLLACTEMTCTIPISIYSIYIANLGVELKPWVSWSETHFGFSRVDQIPSVVWRSDPSFRTSAEMTRWLYPVCALLFFALFGFASEAQKNYRLAFWRIAGLFGIKPSGTKKPLVSLIVHKKVSKSSSFAAITPPPAYTTAPARLRDNPESVVSTLTGSGSCNNFDVEKAAGLSYHCSPVLDITHEKAWSPTSSTHNDSESSDASHTEADDAVTILCSDNESDQHRQISVSDLYPQYYSTSRSSSPSTPNDSNPVPLWHRPFSPPSIYPVVSEHPSSRHIVGPTIQVIVHKESTTSF